MISLAELSIAKLCQYYNDLFSDPTQHLNTIVLANHDSTTTISDDEMNVLHHNLKTAIATIALYHVMEDYRQQGQVHYSIAPELTGPIVEALDNDDIIYPHYRDVQLSLARNDCDLAGLIRGYFCSSLSPYGGRHRIVATEPNVMVSVPTVGADFPRALGHALAIDLFHFLTIQSKKDHRICVISGGDGTIDHPSALSTLNMACHFSLKEISLPLLFLIKDNGIAISERTSHTQEKLQRWGLTLFSADTKNPLQVYRQAQRCQQYIRHYRKPAILYLQSYRVYGHSANPRNENFNNNELELLRQQHPLLYAMKQGIELNCWQISDCAALFQHYLLKIRQLAESIKSEPKLNTKDVAKPLSIIIPPKTTHKTQSNKLYTYRQLLTACYRTILTQDQSVLMYGQDIKHGGHYGVTLGLDKLFPKQVYGLPIDEIALIGIANGLAMAGLLPIVEVSYAAYFNEGALSQVFTQMLACFLAGKKFSTGMIIRMPAFGLVTGGPTHTENSFPERYIPGLVQVCAGTVYSASLCVAHAYQMAKAGNIVIFREPTQQYMLKPQHYPGNCEILFKPAQFNNFVYGDILIYQWQNKQLHICDTTSTHSKNKLLILTYGNGIYLSIQALSLLDNELTQQINIVEYPNLFASEQLLSQAKLFSRILIVDESRRPTCPGESIYVDFMTKIKPKYMTLLTANESFNPGGDIMSTNYLTPTTIADHCQTLVKL